MGQAGTTTATVLFTEGAADEHLLRDVVSDHAGRVLKTADDGLMAVFGAASDGVAAAVALQQGVRAADPARSIRVGVAAGDVSWELDECFGPPVVTAARLESAAQPGEILVSAVVRLMAGDRAGVHYAERLSLQLEGQPAPVDAFAVLWDAPPRTETGWTFPFTLAAPTARPFVGREEELATLRRCWAEVSGAGRGMVLIGGDAGAGKTRLATQLAHEAHAADAIVLSGVCDSDLSLPYQPWVMALHQLLQQLPDPAIDRMRPDLGHLTVLVPQIEQLVAGLGRPDPVDPEAERHRVFNAIRAVFSAGAALAPTVLVLDDLHWAGQQTLAVLRYLARAEPVSGLLIVATFRDTEDEVDDQLAATLADLRRVDWVTRIKLAGLTPAAVLELLAGQEQTTHRDLTVLASTIAERTGGNPFFVTELCDHLARSTAPGEGVPESIKEIVAVRLQRLSPAARDVAHAVAVAASRVELAVLREASSASAPDVVRTLEELLRSGLVEEVPGPLPTFQYAHSLLRDAVTESLPALSRARLHLAIASALERVHEADRRLVLAGLTRHFAAAASVGGGDKAAYYGRRAAAQARRTSAYDEAISLLRIALGVAPHSSPERAELLVDLVDLLQRSGRLLDATEVSEEAYEAASLAGDVALRAEAAMGFERSAHLAHIPTAHAKAPGILTEVLRDVSEEETPLRARLLASVGRAKALVGDAGAQQVSVDALAVARRVGDVEAIGLSLEAAVVTETDPVRLLELARELEQHTDVTGNAWRSMWATGAGVRAFLELGRLEEARETLDRHRGAAHRNRFGLFRFQSYVLSAALALVDGQLDLAEREIEAAAELELADDTLGHSGVYGLVMFMIRREQGRLEEMRPVLRLLSGSAPPSSVWGPGLALAYAELGMRAEAADAFSRLSTDAFRAVPRDRLWPVALSFLAETCLALEETGEAPVLAAELEAFSGTTLMAGFTVCAGPADRLRAALSELAGRPDQADALIAAAHDLATRSGSPLWCCHVESTWASMLGRRGDPDAAIHLERAAALASAHGVVRADRRFGPAPAPGTGASPADLPNGLSRREADVLALVAAGRSNREIAEALFISPNTAANHVRSILQKTASANRTEAAAYAIRHGLHREGGGS